MCTHPYPEYILCASPKTVVCCGKLDFRVRYQYQRPHPPFLPTSSRPPLITQQPFGNLFFAFHIFSSIPFSFLLLFFIINPHSLWLFLSLLTNSSPSLDPTHLNASSHIVTSSPSLPTHIDSFSRSSIFTFSLSSLRRKYSRTRHSLACHLDLTTFQELNPLLFIHDQKNQRTRPEDIVSHLLGSYFLFSCSLSSFFLFKTPDRKVFFTVLSPSGRGNKQTDWSFPGFV